MFETIPEGAEKLTGDAQMAWVKTANEALDEGYDEIAAAAIAWTVAKKVNADDYSPDVIYNYPAWRPGKYIAAMGGEFEVEQPDIADMAEAINRLYELGHPVALIDGHGSGRALGSMPAARVDGEVLRSACIVDWMTASGIREGTYGLSVEANKDYNSEAYTGGKEYRYWPTAWAVLPAGEQPAVPPGEPIAAKDETKPVRLYAHETAPDGGVSPDERGQIQMEELKELKGRLEVLEAAQAESSEKVAALEKERDELKAQNEELAAKVKAAEDEKAQAELAAAEAAVTERAQTIMTAEARPGVREKMEQKLAAAETVEAKGALLDAWESVMDEDQVKKAKLKASESKPDGDSESASNGDAILAEANKIQAAEKCDFTTALKMAASKFEPKEEGE